MDHLIPVFAQSGIFGVAFTVVFFLFRSQVRFLERQVEVAQEREARWQQLAMQGTDLASRGTAVAAELVEPLRRRRSEEERLRRLEAAVQVLVRRVVPDEEE